MASGIHLVAIRFALAWANAFETGRQVRGPPHSDALPRTLQLFLVAFKLTHQWFNAMQVDFNSSWRVSSYACARARLGQMSQTKVFTVQT